MVIICNCNICKRVREQERFEEKCELLHEIEEKIDDKEIIKKIRTGWW